jgi:glutamyl-tRNA synthetase
MPLTEDIKSEILAYTLKNAVEHQGKPLPQVVLGKIIANHPDLRSNVAELKDLIEETARYVANLPLEIQRKELLKFSAIVSGPKPREEPKQKLVPELPNRPPNVVTRFAPNPDGPIHIGNLRAAVLSYTYARIYNGKFILRLEDTDPKIKPPMLRAYDWIKEDLKWLGLNWDEFYIQSDRLDLYYEYAFKLTEKGDAYVCECPPDLFKSFKAMGKSCPHRSRSDSVSLLQKMISGGLEEGKAVLRLKTSMENPNPALRDPPLLRIINTNVTPHPRLGSKYKVFPLYNFSAAIDDSLMGVTLVLRGKEHMTNGLIQSEIQERLGLASPLTVEFGRLNLEGYILSKSKIKSSLRSNEFQSDWPSMNDGWDDPRLGTIMSLRRRGIQPQALVQLMLEIGAKPIEATISWDNLAAYNRRIIEPEAKRFFAVIRPKTLRVRGVPSDSVIKAKIKIHPSRPELGEREIIVPVADGSIQVLISSSDAEGLPKEVRLMDLFNVVIEHSTEDGVEARFKSRDIQEAKLNKYPIIQWVPNSSFVGLEIYKADGLKLEKLIGAIERSVLTEPLGSIIQLIRIGYARIDGINSIANKTLIRMVYTHD